MHAYIHDCMQVATNIYLDTLIIIPTSSYILIHLPLVEYFCFLAAARCSFSSLVCSFISLRILFLSSLSFFLCSFCASFSRFFSSFSCRNFLLSALVNTLEDVFALWENILDGGVGGRRKRESPPTDCWDLENVVIPAVKGTKVPWVTWGRCATIVTSG